MNAYIQSPKSEAKHYDYAKLIPIVTAGLIILGVSRLIIYYSLFEINILSFLDFGEIITSFLDIVLSIILSIVLAGALYYTFLQKSIENLGASNLSTEEVGKSQHESFNTEKLNDVTKRYKRVIRHLFALILLVAFLLALLIAMINADLKIALLLIGILVVVAILSLLLKKIYNKQQSRIIKDLCVIAIVFLPGETNIIILTTSNYQQVLNENRYLGTKIVFNNEVKLTDSSYSFISDSMNFYIGNTRNYIFIHNKKEQVTSVLPMSGVIQIDFKRVIFRNWFNR